MVWGEGKKAPYLKNCYTNRIMMKLGTVIPYLKKAQKVINHMTQALIFADISIFHRKSAFFLLYQEIRIWIAF